MNTRHIDTFKDSDGIFDFDVYCPQCYGEGEIVNTETDEREECSFCEGTPYFEVMWNWAFPIPFLKDGLSFEEARKIAWSQHWLLVKDSDDEMWIMAGKCGFDFTWDRAELVLDICGRLPYEHAESLSHGGHVFASDSKRTEIAKAAVEAMEHKLFRIHQDISAMKRIAEGQVE